MNVYNVCIHVYIHTYIQYECVYNEVTKTGEQKITNKEKTLKQDIRISIFLTRNQNTINQSGAYIILQDRNYESSTTCPGQNTFSEVFRSKYNKSYRTCSPLCCSSLFIF